MAKALIIRTDGTHEVKEFNAGESYDTISKGVGGWIELVQLPKLNVDMWVNEEGKLKGLGYNFFGTILWEMQYGLTEMIVGDIVLTGGVDDEGDTLGLSEETLQKFLMLIS